MFNCANITLPATSTLIQANATSTFNIAPCLIPNYISSLPFDPSKIDAHYTSDVDYNTGYRIFQDINGRITVSADGEINPSIEIKR